MCEDKNKSATATMSSSFWHVKEWQEARERKDGKDSNNHSYVWGRERKWTPPPINTFKVNVDASVFPGALVFSVGMVIRDHKGVFLEGRNLSLPCPSSLVEAECIGVREALSWVMIRQEKRVVVETDSLLTVAAIQSAKRNMLKVGHVVDQCKAMLEVLSKISVIHICKHSNKVAHGLARLPCLVNSFNVFTSPPSYLLETILYDASS